MLRDLDNSLDLRKVFLWIIVSCGTIDVVMIITYSAYLQIVNQLLDNGVL